MASDSTMIELTSSGRDGAESNDPKRLPWEPVLRCINDHRLTLPEIPLGGWKCNKCQRDRRGHRLRCNGCNFNLCKECVQGRFLAEAAMGAETDTGGLVSIWQVGPVSNDGQALEVQDEPLPYDDASRSSLRPRVRFALGGFLHLPLAYGMCAVLGGHKFLFVVLVGIIPMLAVVMLAPDRLRSRVPCFNKVWHFLVFFRQHVFFFVAVAFMSVPLHLYWTAQPPPPGMGSIYNQLIRSFACVCISGPAVASLATQNWKPSSEEKQSEQRPMGDHAFALRFKEGKYWLSLERSPHHGEADDGEGDLFRTHLIVKSSDETSQSPLSFFQRDPEEPQLELGSSRLSRITSSLLPRNPDEMLQDTKPFQLSCGGEPLEISERLSVRVFAWSHDQGVGRMLLQLGVGECRQPTALARRHVIYLAMLIGFLQQTSTYWWGLARHDAPPCMLPVKCSITNMSSLGLSNVSNVSQITCLNYPNYSFVDRPRNLSSGVMLCVDQIEVIGSWYGMLFSSAAFGMLLLHAVFTALTLQNFSEAFRRLSCSAVACQMLSGGSRLERQVRFLRYVAPVHDAVAWRYGIIENIWTPMFLNKHKLDVLPLVPATEEDLVSMAWWFRSRLALLDAVRRWSWREWPGLLAMTLFVLVLFVQLLPQALSSEQVSDSDVVDVMFTSLLYGILFCWVVYEGGKLNEEIEESLQIAERKVRRHQDRHYLDMALLEPYQLTLCGWKIQRAMLISVFTSIGGSLGMFFYKRLHAHGLDD